MPVSEEILNAQAAAKKRLQERARKLRLEKARERKAKTMVTNSDRSEESKFRLYMAKMHLISRLNVEMQHVIASQPTAMTAFRTKMVYLIGLGNPDLKCISKPYDEKPELRKIMDDNYSIMARRID